MRKQRISGVLIRLALLAQVLSLSAAATVGKSQIPVSLSHLIRVDHLRGARFRNSTSYAHLRHGVSMMGGAQIALDAAGMSDDASMHSVLFKLEGSSSLAGIKIQGPPLSGKFLSLKHF